MDNMTSKLGKAKRSTTTVEGHNPANELKKKISTASDSDEDDTDEEPLELSIDNFGRPHGVTGQVDYSFRSLPHALYIPEDERSYREIVADCETAFTAREIEDTEYSTGTTFFLPASMEPRCLLERMARSVFDFHTKDIKEYDRKRSGAEWWTLVLDSTNQDDVSFHWDRDYGLEGSHRVNLHPHVATVTYLSDAGGPTIVLDKVSPVHTGSEECGAGVIEKGYLSRPMLGKHISFDGRLLHGAPGDLSPIFSSSLPKNVNEVTGQKRKQPALSTQRVTFLVNVWLNHKPIESDLFPESDLVSFCSSIKSPIHFELANAEMKLTVDEEVQTIRVENEPNDRVKKLDLTFVEAGRQMSLVLPIPVAALQDSTQKIPDHSSFELVFGSNDRSQACLSAGDEVDCDSGDEGSSSEEDDA